MNPVNPLASRLAGAVLLSAVVVVLGTSCSITPEPDPTPVGQFAIVQVPVDSDPTGATIYHNGRPVGSASVSLRVEVNEFGDMIDDLRLQADFSTSFSQTPTSAVVEQEFTRGDKPPSVVRFRTDGADSRSR